MDGAVLKGRQAAILQYIKLGPAEVLSIGNFSGYLLNIYVST
jgi:hypothetical protein